MNNHKISVVIPLYNCAPYIVELCERLKSTTTNLKVNYEIIFVNDASPKNDWEIVKKLSANDECIKGLNLSRNFGQHYAISAGLKYVTGDWIVVMDGDLQDQPEEISKLYEQINKGYDVVFGRREIRKDKFFKRLRSKVFYKIYNFFTDSKFDNTIANFSISSKQVVNEFIEFSEQDRSFPLIIQWLGFNIGYVNIVHASRKNGKSSYSLKKLIHFASSSIISQSNKPLKISIVFGLASSILSFIFTLYIIYRKVFLGVPVTGWASLIISVFFIGGLILANIGIVGIYIGRIFNETKNRPLYIIKNKLRI